MGGILESVMFYLLRCIYLIWQVNFYWTKLVLKGTKNLVGEVTAKLTLQVVGKSTKLWVIMQSIEREEE